MKFPNRNASGGSPEGSNGMVGVGMLAVIGALISNPLLVLTRVPAPILHARSGSLKDMAQVFLLWEEQDEYRQTAGPCRRPARTSRH